MPSLTAPLPNIRKLFIPDPGYTIMDWDLDRADLQVVVWEAGDEDLKRQLRLGVDIHLMNGILLGGKEPPPEDELIESHPEYERHKALYKALRQFAKMFCHGTNYGGSARTMAINCGVTVFQSEQNQKRWFELHPGIKEWHHRVEMQLQRTRSIANAFGYRRVYFDRVDGLLPEALAWVPQSTVALVINKGLARVDAELSDVQNLIQVHDSLVQQCPTRVVSARVPQIAECLRVTIPYEDPLVIPVGCKASTKSWGDCKAIKIPEAA